MASVPILMYHSISDQDETGVSPYYRTCTSPRMFAEQMRFISERGYRTISLPEARRRLQAGDDVAKTAVITFDDGFRDFHLEAFPVLNGFGQTATMFLPTSFIGDTRRKFKGRECLTWEDVRALRRHGINFGSHTVTHPKLVTLPVEAILRELADSKQEIEQQIGEKVETFAYPYAFPQENAGFRSSFESLLGDAGYSVSVTTIIGRVAKDENPLRWKRLPVNSDDDLNLFEAKLAGAYDWLSVAQGAFKRLKQTVSR